MKTFSVILPSSWASALINGDRSGLSEDDAHQLDQCLTERPEWRNPASCKDYGFKWSHDATPYGTLGCDCRGYIYLTT